MAALYVVGQAPPDANIPILLTSLLATLALNGALVYWALLPLRTLEATAVKVSHGDLAARFKASPFADRNIAHIGRTVNELLDHLTTDRERARHLASQVISAADRERARIARELHDSTAQSLSGLEMMLSAAAANPSIASPDQLKAMHEIARQALGEARTLSHTVHPRVLDDLGLVAAIEQLVRRTRQQVPFEVWVSSDAPAVVPDEIASVLYRVAQEAVGNAVRHSRATRLDVSVKTGERSVILEVRDNGIGFDERSDASQEGLGLFSMRERVALVNGSLFINSAPGRGTVVRAECPLSV